VGLASPLDNDIDDLQRRQLGISRLPELDARCHRWQRKKCQEAIFIKGQDLENTLNQCRRGPTQANQSLVKRAQVAIPCV
jgi:hypothetical protein